MAFGDERKPLQRTTRLQARAPWPPPDQPRTPLPRGESQLRRTGFKTRPRPAASPADVGVPTPAPSKSTRQRRGAFTPATRQLIYARDDHRCVLCDIDPHDSPLGRSAHHRRPRSNDGYRIPWVRRAANGLYLCGTGTTGCHGWVESNRPKAARHGWWISPQSGAAAAEIPVWYPWLGLVRLLDDEGNATPVAEVGPGEWWSVEHGVRRGTVSMPRPLVA